MRTGSPSGPPQSCARPANAPTRAGHEPVVIVALADYESLKETAYLLRSPENARRLLASIDRLEHGGGIERDLLE